MSTLKVLLISDGRPGHFRIAEGIIAAMGRARRVETLRLDVRRRRVLPGRILALLHKGGISADRILAAGYGYSAGLLPHVHCIVSAGGDTLAANVAAARVLQVPNIFYGSLRLYAPGDFALSLSSYERPGQIMTLKPSAFDPDTLPTGASSWGLILGGNTPEIRYELEDWQRLGAFLKAILARFGTKWIVSNSRRTPREATQLFAEMALEADGPIVRFIDVGKPGAESLVGLFSSASKILCTADSSSMVSEAVWARRPVVAIRPSHFRLTDAEGGYRSYLERKNWARGMAIADLTPEELARVFAEITPLSENPLDLLADTLVRELPMLFEGRCPMAITGTAAQGASPCCEAASWDHASASTTEIDSPA